MVYAALKDAAAVSMSTNHHAVGTDSIVDELRVICRKTIEALLDDMVTIQVLDQLHNMIL